MDTTKDLINTMKWQLLARLPKGSIFERIKGSILGSGLDSSNPLYYIYWMDINRNLFQKFLFGTFGTTNEDYEKFIFWLDSLYLKEGHYEINVGGQVIILQRPSYEDYKCFKAEFLDIIMPTITNGTDKTIPYLEGPYENGNVCLEGGYVVLDLGANYGLFSSLASSKDCLVYAFEPTKHIVERYLNNLALIDENIKIINKAVSNCTGIVHFKEYQGKSSCNKIVDGNEECTEVMAITIDNFVQEEGLSSVDFIKADIEGAERLMLEGARYTLKEMAPKLAICFYHCLDDLKILTGLIKDANPKYQIDVKYKKIYAHVPGKNNH